jgi:hypothetical protein
MRENSGKRKRARRREGREGKERVMEEEIVVPRITQHSTFPLNLVLFTPLVSFFLLLYLNPRLFKPSDRFTSHSISSHLPLLPCFLE